MTETHRSRSLPSVQPGPEITVDEHCYTLIYLTWCFEFTSLLENCFWDSWVLLLLELSQPWASTRLSVISLWSGDNEWISFWGRIAFRRFYVLEVWESGWAPRLGYGGEPGGLLSLYTPQSSFKDEEDDQALGLSLLNLLNVLLTSGGPCGKGPCILEITVFSAQFQIICHLLGLTSSLVPFPKIKEKPCPSHSDYLSIKNLPTQPSPHKALLRRETSNISSSVICTGLWFSSLNKLSLPLLIVLGFCGHSLSTSCSIRAPKVTMDPGRSQSPLAHSHAEHRVHFLSHLNVLTGQHRQPGSTTEGQTLAIVVPTVPLGSAKTP